MNFWWIVKSRRTLYFPLLLALFIHRLSHFYLYKTGRCLTACMASLKLLLISGDSRFSDRHSACVHRNNLSNAISWYCPIFSIMSKLHMNSKWRTRMILAVVREILLTSIYPAPFCSDINKTLQSSLMRCRWSKALKKSGRMEEPVEVRACISASDNVKRTKNDWTTTFLAWHRILFISMKNGERGIH